MNRTLDCIFLFFYFIPRFTCRLYYHLKIKMASVSLRRNLSSRVTLDLLKFRGSSEKLRNKQLIFSVAACNSNAKSCDIASSRSISTTTPFPEFSDLPDIKTHADLYQFSLEQPDTFWSRLARSRLTWSKDFSVVNESDFKNGKSAWFTDGKLNASGKIIYKYMLKIKPFLDLIYKFMIHYSGVPNNKTIITENCLEKFRKKITVILPPYNSISLQISENYKLCHFFIFVYTQLYNIINWIYFLNLQDSSIKKCK